MKYRVIERRDGLYQSQFKGILWNWYNSTYSPSADRDDQILFAKRCMANANPTKVKVVWPTKGDS